MHCGDGRVWSSEGGAAGTGGFGVVREALRGLEGRSGEGGAAVMGGGGEVREALRGWEGVEW